MIGENNQALVCQRGESRGGRGIGILGRQKCCGMLCIWFLTVCFCCGVALFLKALITTSLRLYLFNLWAVAFNVSRL